MIVFSHSNKLFCKPMWVAILSISTELIKKYMYQDSTKKTIIYKISWSFIISFFNLSYKNLKIMRFLENS